MLESKVGNLHSGDEAKVSRGVHLHSDQLGILNTGTCLQGRKIMVMQDLVATRGYEQVAEFPFPCTERVVPG
jgi:hypothetical protein